MGNSRVLACVLLAGCQPLYGAKPERLARATEAPRPVSKASEPPLVEDCEVNFSGRVATTRQTGPAERRVAVADADVTNAAASPSPDAKLTLVRHAIETYSDALRADPYNAEATLKLALAYDRVLRKGCAIALVKRLAVMADHPKLEIEAKPQLELIVANPHWFRRYRNDVLHAIGH